jgi:protein-arginine kinase
MIHIPTKSSSNEIKRFVVVLIHLQLTLACVVERRRDHVCLMYDLSNGTTLTQKIVVSLILPITEILTIKDYRFYDIFLHTAFESQSLLKSTSDQTCSDTN